MKIHWLLFLLILITWSQIKAQTLQTVVDNGNTTTSPVRFLGHTDFGDSYDPIMYGTLQITRPFNQGNTYHLSFIRQGHMVYGMGLLNNSNVFGIQVGANNTSTNGIFLTESGDIGIGTTSPGEKLSVKGKIRAQEIKVEAVNWPDYVLAKSYYLPSLQETEQHIKENGHLSGIPSASEISANGVNLGEMNAKLLQKIEELTLYLIEKDKQSEFQNKRIEKLEEENIRILNLIKSKR